MDKLTPKQRAVYQFIKQFVGWHGYAPTVREIADNFDLRSTNTVDYHVTALEKKGFIRRRGNMARAIQLVGPENGGREAERIVRIPVEGLIAAGEPIQSLEDRDTWASVAASMAGKPGAYALRVRGDSMIDEHICSGDLVVIEPRSIAKDNEIVVALHEDGVTLKTFFHEGKRIRLQPANKTMKPIYVYPDQSFAIQGILRGVIRQVA